jgi:hypothetical protein
VKISPASLSNRLVAVSIALVLGLAALVWIYHRHSAERHEDITARTDWCRLEESCIVETVYKYQIQNSEGHKPSSLFFLSVGERTDPDREVVNRLVTGSYRVKPISQSVDQHTVIRDKETGEVGVILTVAKITKVDNARVDVELSAYSGWGDVKGYTYHLVRGDNGWLVTDRKFAFES